MENLVKLCEVRENQEVVLCEVEGVEIKKAKRLIELGFVKQAKIYLLKKTKGLILVGIRGSYIAIDEEIAKGIKVFK